MVGIWAGIAVIFVKIESICIELSLRTAIATRLVTSGNFALFELCTHPPWSGFTTWDNYDKPLPFGHDNVQYYGS